jgi:hypothetical protein
MVELVSNLKDIHAVLFNFLLLYLLNTLYIAN